MIGNLLGVLIEGLWYKFQFGAWETHVVTIWGPFCLIYGVGFALFYLAYRKLKDKNIVIQFLAVAILADLIEYVSGWLLMYGLHMRAWNYTKKFMNLQGHICLEMTLAWGVLGVLFIKFIGPLWDRLFEKINTNLSKNLCYAFSVFMLINMSATTVCMVRWRNRHFNIPPANKISRFVDKKYTDERMQKRFIEWHFIK